MLRAEVLSHPTPPEPDFGELDPGHRWVVDPRDGARVGIDTRPAPVVVIPWPRYPTTTPGGKESQAKTAGRLVPWLSANVVNNLAHPVYRQAVAYWREAAWAAVQRMPPPRVLRGRHLVLATLYRATAARMDPGAVWEGIKPAIDGLVVAGMLADDTEAHIAGVLPRCRKAQDRGCCRLELRWRPV